MFNRKKKQQRLMEAIGMIKPTSKAALKQQCLFLSNLDVDKAAKMYDFLIKDMEEIPAIEPGSKTLIDNVKEQSTALMSWLRENEDMLTKGVDFMKGILASRKGAPPAAPLNPIN